MKQPTEELLSDTLDRLPGGVIITDAKGLITTANADACHMFDDSADVLAGNNLASFVTLNEHALGADTNDQVVPGQRTDGREMWVEYSSRRATKESNGIAWTVRDVTERVEREAKGATRSAEAERVRLQAEVVRVRAEVVRSETEQTRLVAEADLIRANGDKAEAERVRLEADVRLVRAEAEKAQAERVRLAAEVTRVTAEKERVEAERVRLEAEVEHEKLVVQLHQSQRMESLGQLAGGVAHDFNNLLSVILNYAVFVSEALVDESSPTDTKALLDDVQQIHLAAERASLLTHQLLSFARGEVVQARPMSLNEAISSIEQILQRSIGDQIELNVSLAPDLKMVTADPGQIEQIILNLAINARDAMPTGGTLAIETTAREIDEVNGPMYGAPSGSYICLRISDNGAGMSEEVRNRAFEPFYTTKPRGEGTGLGLSTVYGIVMQSGGFARIYSDEGVGTTFTILLPTVPDEDIPEEMTEVADSIDHPRSAGTILVVDDEPGLREVARRILSKFGYEVLVADGGAAAIDIATTYEGAIDLLLTDVIMPRMQGPEVAQRVKELRPAIQVLFMSAHAKPVLEAEKILGTDFIFIEKPFDQSGLLAKVTHALNRD